MLKARILHANSVDKLTKIQEQLNTLLREMEDDSLVSIHVTEVGPAGTYEFYSYTIMLVYKTEKDDENLTEETGKFYKR